MSGKIKEDDNDYMGKCGCGGKVVIIYFRDTDGKIKPDYAICTECLKRFVVSD